MRGRAKIKKNLRQPDAKYQSMLVSQMINYIMQDGKKATASKIVYSAMQTAADDLNKQPLDTLQAAIDNAAPQVEVKSKRVGGSTYQVPIDVSPTRKVSLAMRWIITAARNASGTDMATRLSQELINAINNTGAAIKKKEDVRRMAEANKAFAHFERF